MEGCNSAAGLCLLGEKSRSGSSRHVSADARGGAVMGFFHDAGRPRAPAVSAERRALGAGRSERGHRFHASHELAAVVPRAADTPQNKDVRPWHKAKGRHGIIGSAPTDHDKELRKVAEDKIRERNETDLQTLLHLQGREVKSLESEKTWIDKERSRDVQTMNTKEIAAINQRYDRLGSRSGAAEQYVSRQNVAGFRRA